MIKKVGKFFILFFIISIIIIKSYPCYAELLSAIVHRCNNSEYYTVNIILDCNKCSLYTFDIIVKYDSINFTYLGYKQLPLEKDGYKYIFKCLEIEKGQIDIAGVYYNITDPPQKNTWLFAILKFKKVSKNSINNLNIQVVPIEIVNSANKLIIGNANTSDSFNNKKLLITKKDNNFNSIVINESSKNLTKPSLQVTINIIETTKIMKNISSNQSTNTSIAMPQIMSTTNFTNFNEIIKKSSKNDFSGNYFEGCRVILGNEFFFITLVAFALSFLIILYRKTQRR